MRYFLQFRKIYGKAPVMESYDHKDYANFDNAFSIIMKNSPEPIRLETIAHYRTVTKLKTLIGR